VVACKAKKFYVYTVYTGVFGLFLPLKAKNRASEQPIDRSKAHFSMIRLVFCPESKKKPLLSW
jgi:hypothetical protein